MKRFLLPALFAIIAFVACKKEKKEAEIDGYKFKNDLSESVHAVLYGSAVDYINQVNPVWEGDIDAKSTKTVSDEYLTENDSCYIDWYSADGTFSNWITGNRAASIYHNAVMFFTKKSTAYTITDALHYKPMVSYGLRKALLPNEKSSTWKAYDAYSFDMNKNQYISNWDKLDKYKRDITLTTSFKKLSIRYGLQSGEAINDYTAIESEFAGYNQRGVWALGMAYHTLFITNISQPYDAHNWFSNQEIPDIAEPTTDTIFIFNMANQIAYAMARQ